MDGGSSEDEFAPKGKKKAWQGQVDDSDDDVARDAKEKGRGALRYCSLALCTFFSITWSSAEIHVYLQVV